MNRSIAVGMVAWMALGLAGCGSADEPQSDTNDLTSCPSAAALAKKAYPDLPEGYEASTAEEKQQTLWKLLSESEYPAKCGYPNGGIGFITFTISRPIKTLDVTLQHSSDQLPAGRKKFLHPFGSTATFDFVKGPKPEGDTGAEYTGVLAPNDTVKGVTRLSLGGDPHIPGVGFTPGIAVKFLIDGAPSVNVVAMRSLMGQGGDQNFFRFDFSNKLPDPHAGLDPLFDPFDWAKADAIGLGVSWFEVFLADGEQPKTGNFLHVDHLAYKDRRGQLAETPVSPSRLIFRPTKELREWWDGPDNAGIGYRSMLKAIPSGSTIYDVYALRNEGDKTMFLVGSMKTTSAIVPSMWGDFRLFFRHNDVNANEDVRE